jgi:hypothetical protein
MGGRLPPQQNYEKLAKPIQVEYNAIRMSGRGSARLERCVRVAEVPGSNPGAPTKKNRLSGRFFSLLLVTHINCQCKVEMSPKFAK